MKLTDKYSLLPPLSTEDYERLKSDISAHGVRQAIEVDEKGEILDGHHRAQACKELRLIAPIKVVRLDGELSKRAYVYQVNLTRRHLSPEQKDELREEQIKLAREMNAPSVGMSDREIGAALGVPESTVNYWLGRNVSKTKVGKAYVRTDQRVSIPRSRYSEIAKRVKKGEPVVKVAADLGVSHARISQISAIMSARAKPEPAVDSPPAYPQERYSTIVIDPPWPVAKIEMERRPKQGKVLDYATMTLEEITAMPIDKIGRSASHLYLWTTHRFLPDALSMIDEWGFNYQCVLTWVKPTGAPTFGWMYNTELVLFARRGDVPLERMGIKLSFEAPSVKGHHSHKPDVFFDIVRQASPSPRISMFDSGERKGFQIWGAPHDVRS